MKTEPYVVVIGGMNIDIGGRSFCRMVPKDSNPGRIRISLGGVGRNIAHNMALLGMKVVFLTAFGDDIYREMIENACRKQGIDISHALSVPGAVTSSYVFLGGPNGEMELAVSDMEICSSISASYITSKQEIIDGAALVVIDANLPEETILHILTHTGIPVFADPVSAAKAGRLRPCLDRIHTIKPNRLEAQALSGIRITDERSAREALTVLIGQGVKRVFMTMGAEGVMAAEHVPEYLRTEADQDTGTAVNFIRLPCAVSRIQNATGAGDAFMAGLVCSYLQDMNLEETVRTALAAGGIAAEGEDTINEELTLKEVRRRAGVPDLYEEQAGQKHSK